jgi:predicted ArsR family transcriptional regulator
MARDDASTRDLVTRHILQHGASSAAAIAERLALTPAAVRRHLEQLVAEGAIEAREPRAAADRGRGRPAKVFTLTDRGRDGFPQGYDALATQALRFLAATKGEAGVREFADQRASFISERFRAVFDSDDGISPAEALARVFSDEGYVASVRRLPLVDGAVAEQLCQQHCPVAHVASEFPQLCEAETAAIGEVLGTHVQRLATIAHGDGVCTTCIPTSASSTQTGTAHQKKEQVTT